MLFVLQLVGLQSPSNAFAWGLSTELNEPWASARLVFPALKYREIKYCIQNGEPARFDTDSMALQIESALGLWLAPLVKIGIGPIKVSRVNCESGNYNILLQIGAEVQWKNLGSYQLSQWEGDHYFSLVKFDTGFLSQEDGGEYPITDFKTYAGGLAGEPNIIQSVSFARPSSLRDFSLHAQLDYRSVFWSTYPSLIHELGHSFGLCDTYEAKLKDACDPNYSSALQPESVMKDSSFFYLTDDDVTGIQRLFLRFR